MKSSKLISLALTMLFSLLTFGQEPSIHGIVSDDSGLLPGATVVVKGTNRGTQTDLDGKFSIRTMKTDTLVFSFTGMKTQIIAVKERYTINVKLKEAIQLEEKIPECIGISRKKIALKDVTIVSKEDIEKVTPKPEKTPVIVHCARTIKSCEKPLWVVDGFISTEKNSKELNPDNIKSVNILKGAEATALYGSKGMNGVILITTQNLTKKELRKLKRKSERDYEEEKK